MTALAFRQGDVLVLCLGLRDGRRGHHRHSPVERLGGHRANRHRDIHHGPQAKKEKESIMTQAERTPC